MTPMPWGTGFAISFPGKIAQTGRTDEIFRYPQTKEVDRFVGIDNLLPGHVLNSGTGYSQVVTGSGLIRIFRCLPNGCAGYPRDSRSVRIGNLS